MNQDIDMLNIDDLNMDYNPQPNLISNKNVPTPHAVNNSEHLNGQFNSPNVNSVLMGNVDHIENINENAADSEENDEDDDGGGGDDANRDAGGDANNSNKNDEDDNDDDGDEDDLFMNDNETKTPGEILDEFCQKLEDINTTLPDSVINYYMRKSGFIVNDPKLVKIISIASQKFISEIVNDVWQRQRLKTKQGSNTTTTTTSQATSGSAAPTNASSNPTTSSAASATAGTSSASASGSEQPKLTKAAMAAASSNAANASNTAQLTLEDLTQVLADYGINATSVPVERVFSHVSFQVSARRNKLLGDALEDIMFLYENPEIENDDDDADDF